MSFNVWDFVGKVGRAAVNSGLESMTNTLTGRFQGNCTVEAVNASTAQEVTRFIQLNQPARNETVILIGPNECGSSSGGFLSRKQQAYNIVLRQPADKTSMFSIFRTDDVLEATKMLEIFKSTIGAMAELDSKVYDKTILDKICAKLREPETEGWTPLHLAAAFDLSNMGAPILAKHLNSKCASTKSRTPLHVAIVYQNFAAVFELLSLGAATHLKDSGENNVIHLGVESTVDILRVLLEGLPEKSNHSWMTEVNANGFTPFQAACKRDKAEIVQELVSHYPQLLQQKNPKDGTTPLHFAGGPNTLELFLNLDCEPSVCNNFGQTALHSSVLRSCLQSVICLMCHSGASSCDKQDSAGDTALHIAARLGLKGIIQVLIVFGANVDLVNNQGETARHILGTSQRANKDNLLFYLSAIGAKRCPEALRTKCRAGCLYSGSFEGIPPENYKHPQQDKESVLQSALSAFSFNKEMEEKVSRMGLGDNPESEPGSRLLCLDGGGIRGVVLTQMLLYLEQEFEMRIMDSFDWIAGTSTGGILALGIACGKSVTQLQGLYLRLKDRVFIGERPYRSEPLDEFLRQEFGETTRMSTIRHPRLMITTAMVDKIPAEFHLFRNYKSPRSLLGEKETCPHEDELIWECAKRTGAAPSFFRLEGRFIDGGLISNNPTMDALSELMQFKAAFGALKKSEKGFTLPRVVVSLGTGIQPPQECSARNLDICWPSTLRDAMTAVPKLANLVNLLVDQATQAEGQVVERSRAWCSSIGVPFFRFSPRMSTTIELDERRDEVLVNLMWETRAYMIAHRHEVVQLSHILKRN